MSWLQCGHQRWTPFFHTSIVGHKTRAFSRQRQAGKDFFRWFQNGPPEAKARTQSQRLPICWRTCSGFLLGGNSTLFVGDTTWDYLVALSHENIFCHWAQLHTINTSRLKWLIQDVSIQCDKHWTIQLVRFLIGWVSRSTSAIHQWFMNIYYITNMKYNHYTILSGLI